MPCDLSDIQAAACASGIGREQNKIKLLQLIAQLTCEAAEGTGSCFQCSSGSGAPSSPPAEASQPAQYQDTGGGFTYDWDIETAQWIAQPKVYKALLSQSGTAAPTAIVLVNTFGGTIAWSRFQEGVYFGTLANAFPQNSTFVFYASHGNGNSITKEFLVTVSGGDTVGVDSYDNAVRADGLLARFPLEIQVYP